MAATPKVYLPGAHEQTAAATDWFGDAAFHQIVPFAVAGRHFFLVLRSSRMTMPSPASMRRWARRCWSWR